jgi:hypothetical protein
LVRPTPATPQPQAAPPPPVGSVRERLARLRVEQKTQLDEARQTFLISIDDKLADLTPNDLLKAYQERVARDVSVDGASVFFDWPKAYWEMGFSSEKDLDAQLQALPGFKKAHAMALEQGFSRAHVCAWRSGGKTTVSFRVSYAAL